MNISKTDRIKEVWMQVRDRKKLATLMAINDISQRELATIVGWKSHSYLGRILRGDIKSIDPDTAVKIAAVFGVGVDDLFLPRVSTASEQNAHQRGAA